MIMDISDLAPVTSTRKCLHALMSIFSLFKVPCSDWSALTGPECHSVYAEPRPAL